ncbi:helix-turn-helix transcriptional regulator [Amycolatopsis saalfeldensis]|uniref:Regulatory protein, luxR family n=1 Tax=Amycolatopsis saalfeldensis TaxID=394193 RepID=A0A1H8YEE7_9PSEU|nr:LuxR family transcriptional regulator [Amycolatopsis saalfeldensis]SEP50506.1 regulatory protein, luxR family [Amycolatopsis saalfeldensis]
MNALLAKTGTEAVHPVARRLLAELADAPATPARLVVVAPGGYGKTALLGALDRGYRAAGVEATLVDDADQLGEEDLARLSTLATTAEGPIVLAHRPNAGSEALRTLGEAFGRQAPQIVLTPLGPDEVAALARQLTGRSVDAKTAAALHTRTGGVPRLVERVVTGRLSDFRAELAELDEDVLRYLIAAEAGAGRNLDLLCALLGRSPDRLPEIVDGARATGLLDAEDALLPVAAEAVRTYGPPARRLTALQQLVELQLRNGLPVLELAKSLLDTGSSGSSAAAAFAAAAGEALPTDAKLAASLYEAASEAGTRDALVTTGWARAAALSGDLDTALRLGDGMLSAADLDTRAAGAEIAATVLAHRGELARSAELYRWAGLCAAEPNPDSADGADDFTGPSPSAGEGYRWTGQGAVNAFAAIALVGTGELAGAREVLRTPAPGMAPTLFAGAASRTADGIAESVTGHGTESLSTLVGAAAMLEPSGGGAPLPDSPAALAAIVGLHTGELGLAESVLTRALASEVGGDLLATRHRLLLGWVAMTAGNLSTADEHRNAVAASGRLEARDELFFATLELGLARRASDLVGLQRSWDRAYQASMRQQTDLFTLLPLGELAIAAARTGAHAKLARQLERAHEMLDRLANPPLWTVSLCWHELHAAITLEDRATVEKQLTALAGFADCGRYPSALARAASCWLAVLSGTFEPDTISAAAAELHELGLGWDAARLAGQAAIRTSDRKAMVQLLEAARQFQGITNRRESHVPEPTAGAGLSALSERELEVARLVVEGLTYKQAGSKLFISGKTVEHHMARIRGKLGATDRRELLATLRELLTKPDPS